MTKPHEAWFDRAGDDLAFGRAGLRDGFLSHACVLAQQAVEKAMKGFLVFQDRDYPKSHDLITLLRLMGVKWLDEHSGPLKKLSEFYVPLRYPDAFGTLPEGPPNKEIAGQSLDWAEEIIALIVSKTK